MTTSRVGGQYGLYPAGVLVALTIGLDDSVPLFRVTDVWAVRLMLYETSLMLYSLEVSVKIVKIVHISFSLSCLNCCASHGLWGVWKLITGMVRDTRLLGREIGGDGS